ncbi:MAG: tetratricopeptide repeat protein [Candidatus Omnitrophica bacterium]|nr:tetratricopeptide repeat protein [Candidatus Omnitrophota bacterium]
MRRRSPRSSPWLLLAAACWLLAAPGAVVAADAQPQEARSHDEATLQEGVKLYRLQRYAEALPLLRGLLVGSVGQPIRATASYYVAEVEYYTGRPVDAMAHYRQAQSLAPESQIASLAQYGLGWALYQAQHYEDSIAAFQGFLRGSAQANLQDSARYALGMAQRAAGHPVEALATFDQLLQATPNSPWAASAAMAQGELLLDQHRPTEALAQFQRVADHSQEPALQADALLAAARLLAELGRSDEAFKAYTTFLERFPHAAEAPETALWCATTLLRQERWAQAEPLLRQIVTTPSAPPATLAEAGCWLGWMAERQGQPAAAQHHYDAVLRAAPQSGWGLEARLRLATLLAAQGEVDQAVSRLREAPSRRALTYAANLLRQANRPHDAIDLYAQALPQPLAEASDIPALTETGDASGASLQFAMATAYEEDRQLDAAIRAYLALARDPAADHHWTMKAQLACAKLYEETERYAEARALYESIARSPAEEAKYAYERLEWLDEQRRHLPR